MAFFSLELNVLFIKVLFNHVLRVDSLQNTLISDLVDSDLMRSCICDDNSHGSGLS